MMPAPDSPPEAKLDCVLREAFSRRQFGLQNEEQLQNQVAEILTEAGHTFRRECSLNARDRVDFFVDRLGVAIEVKITRDRYNILAQMRRYALSPFVHDLILVAIMPMTVPPTLAGKPIHCVSVFTCLI